MSWREECIEIRVPDQTWSHLLHSIKFKSIENSLIHSEWAENDSTLCGS